MGNDGQQEQTQDDLLLSDVAVEEPTPKEEETPEETPPQEQPPEPEPLKEAAEQKMVPLQALQEARDQVKFYKNQMQMVDILKQQFEDLRAKQQPQQQAQPQVEPQIPNFQDDAFGHIMARLQNAENFVKQVTEQQQQGKQVTEQQQKQMQDMNNLATAVSQQVNEFRSQQPDYDQALEYLSQKRVAELNAVGITNPYQQQQEINRMAMQMSVQALRNNVNPAQAAYNLAKGYGYQPAQQQQNVQQNVSQHQSTLDTVQQGMQNASRRIQHGSGVEEEISAQSLLNAQGEEFDKLWNKFFSKEINR